MKVSLICVNYNSYRNLIDYLKSIDDALKKSLSRGDNIVLDVFVADNSSNKIEISEETRSFTVKIVNNKNLGYFGGVWSVRKSFDFSSYNYIILSNVDLLLDPSFFCTLYTKQYDCNVAWIAPSIYSLDELRDRNPVLMKRRSIYKMFALYVMYSMPFIAQIYSNSLYRRKRHNEHLSGDTIYAGHGSFFILSNFFFNKCLKFYPIFLYEEEAFVAELIRKKALKVIYDCDLKITDFEHISTSRMLSKENYKCRLTAIKYIIRKFYFNEYS